jgi:hypothetical protein
MLDVAIKMEIRGGIECRKGKDVCYGTILEFSRRIEENNVDLISAWLISCPNLETVTSYTQFRRNTTGTIYLPIYLKSAITVSVTLLSVPVTQLTDM